MGDAVLAFVFLHLAHTNKDLPISVKVVQVKRTQQMFHDIEKLLKHPATELS